MKTKQWYQKHHRVSDQKAPTGTNGASYHAREPIEEDDERLSMRKGDMPPLVSERIANPRIREDRAIQDFRQNSEKMHCATSPKCLPTIREESRPGRFSKTCRRISEASSFPTWVLSSGRVGELIILPIIIRLSFTQRMTSTVALWLSFHGESQQDPEL